MEDRVRALEEKLGTLSATINTSKWWIIAAGAAIVAWLGATSIFTIPDQVQKGLVANGMIQANERMSVLEQQSTADRDSIAKVLSDLSTAPLKLYQCPWNDSLKGGGGAWASIGCVGQIGNLKECTNIYFVDGVGGKSVRFPCTPIGIYAQK